MEEHVWVSVWVWGGLGGVGGGRTGAPDDVDEGLHVADVRTLLEQLLCTV
jgi:hypothetical protein